MIRVCRALVLSGILAVCSLLVVGCAGLTAPTISPRPTSPATTAAPPIAAVVATPTATARPAPTATLPRPTATTETAALLIGRALLNHPKEYAFETYSVVKTASDQKVESQGRGFVKGDRYRLEVLQGEQLTTVILDGGQNTLDLLSLVRGQKIAIHFTPEALTTTLKVESQTPREQLESLSSRAQIAGTEIVRGLPTTIIETRSANGQLIARHWISIDRGVVLRLERPQADKTTTIEYLNHSVGSQPDDLFVVPSDYKVQDGAAVVKAMNQAQPTPAAKP